MGLKCHLKGLSGTPTLFLLSVIQFTGSDYTMEIFTLFFPNFRP